MYKDPQTFCTDLSPGANFIYTSIGPNGEDVCFALLSINE